MDFNYVKSFIINGLKVDTFLYVNQKFKFVDNVKVNDVFEIINMKLKLHRLKDIFDIKRFIKLIDNRVV